MSPTGSHGGSSAAPTQGVVPTARDCERCLAEVAGLYGAEGDLADALPLMSAGDAQDVLVLADAVADGRPVAPACASCAARYGITDR